MLKLPLTVVFCLFVISSLPQGQASTDLDELLRQADARRQEYVDSFRNLTSLETRVTELFDTNGRPTKRRTVVSDFLVSQSELNGEVSEYRVAREVDGRTVGNPGEDGLRLFKRLASARTLAQQSPRRIQSPSSGHDGRGGRAADARASCLQ